jgi:hypothetical protein
LTRTGRSVSIDLGTNKENKKMAIKKYTVHWEGPNGIRGFDGPIEATSAQGAVSVVKRSLGAVKIKNNGFKKFRAMSFRR